MTDKTEEGSSCLPVRFWGLNPLFWSHMKMFVKKVQSLEEYSDYKGTWGSELNRYEPITVEVVWPSGVISQLVGLPPVGILNSFLVLFEIFVYLFTGSPFSTTVLNKYETY